jgi:hypothetical protein
MTKRQQQKNAPEMSEAPPIFPLARCEAMGEGARRAGEGSLLAKRILLKSSLVSRKSPHPAFGHIDHDQVRSFRSDLINVIEFLKWARDRTENRRPLFLIARLPRCAREKGNERGVGITDFIFECAAT